MSTFSRLQIRDWRQFQSVDIDLAVQTTVLTGPNGCGKTTLLNILSRHFGWNIQFIATPYVGERKKQKYFSDFRELTDLELEGSHGREVGSITYDDGHESKLSVPHATSPNPQYTLNYSSEQPVRGLHIPSHRPSITFQRIENLPTDPKTTQQQYQEFQQLLLQTYGSSSVRNPGIVLKQSLIGMAVFGYGNEAVLANPTFKRLFEEFQEKLRILLPASIGFDKLEIRMPDVVLVTATGDFALDSMSGGINSVLAIAWQIHMYGADGGSCTVIIDEPENHLHPSMQRTLLPNLASAFPDFRFIIATHSPFIVTSNPDAKVYGLMHTDDRLIESQLIDEANLAASPEEVLRDILDVPSTLPVWVEQKISDVLGEFDSIPDERKRADAIYSRLKELGLVSTFKDYEGRKTGGAR